MSAPLTPGCFCWFELSTTNQDSAKNFYSALFDWNSVDDDMGSAGIYTRFTIEGQDVGAACTLHADQLKQSVPPNWLLYVLVDNADASAARISGAGGTLVVPPFDVSTLGRMAVIADPSGAVFATWEAKSHIGVGITGVPHTACWADLSTPDVAAATAFYGAAFGWTFVGSRAGEPASPDDYLHIVNGAQMIGGIPPASTRQPGAPPNWMIYFEVENCATAVTKARSLGATVHMDTLAIGENGTIAVLADREGAVFALHQPPSE